MSNKLTTIAMSLNGKVKDKSIPITTTLSPELHSMFTSQCEQLGVKPATVLRLLIQDSLEGHTKASVETSEDDSVTPF